MSYSTASRRIEKGNQLKNKISTRQFGDLEFDDDIVHTFPSGLPGFEDLHKFIIIDDKDTEPLKWMLSTEDPSVGFAILDANLLAPDLYNELPDEDRTSSAMFVVVVLRRDPEPITANLKAPIIVNTHTRSGRQLVLNTEKYSTDHKII